LFSPELKNGVVVQVAALSEYPSLEAFGKAIAALPLEIHLDTVPHVRFHSLRGADIDFTWGEIPKVNGKALDYEHWPLFGGPFVEADINSQKLTLKYGEMRRVLDFRNLSVIDADR
jgi:hypothetical protein